jgi:gamma-glutamyltranspeptidase/glutathione hydrolase
MPSLTPARSVASYGAVVVSPHAVATAAGLEMLAIGGNAVDAAIATNAVQGTVAPETCGIGGDLFALVHTPGVDKPAFLNSSGRAGSAASAAALRDAGHESMPLYHKAAVTIPGCVDGWLALHARFGSLPFDRLLEPAIRLATDGFPASPEFADSFSRRAAELATQPSARAMYPDGNNPVPGDRIVRADLARTLTAVATGERSAFYGGAFGRALVDAVQGAITPEDLTVPQADWQEPLGREVFGLTGWTSPPNTQGYLTLAAARTFELAGGGTDPEDPDFWHLLIEAYRASAWQRDDLLADPRDAEITGEELVAEGRLVKLAAEIDRDRAGTWAGVDSASGGTAYMCAIDHTGMAISLIQSNFHGIGSGVGAGATGVLLHNRGGGFNLRPGHPNELVPGRRPLHTLSPSLWTDGDQLRLVLGTRGGHQQPQMLSTMAALHLHAGLEPGEAQAHPRWTTAYLGGDRSEVQLEGRMSSGISDSLSRRGHTVRMDPDWPRANGPISMIQVTRSGLRIGAADPRVETTMAGAR